MNKIFTCLIIFFFSCSEREEIIPAYELDNKILIQFPDREILIPIDTVTHRTLSLFSVLKISYQSYSIQIQSLIPVGEGYYSTGSTFFSFQENQTLWSKVENSGIFQIDSINRENSVIYIEGNFELDIKSNSDTTHIKGKFRWQ
jgi:hypothetical protein